MDLSIRSIDSLNDVLDQDVDLNREMENFNEDSIDEGI